MAESLTLVYFGTLRDDWAPGYTIRVKGFIAGLEENQVEHRSIPLRKAKAFLPELLSGLLVHNFFKIRQLAENPPQRIVFFGLQAAAILAFFPTNKLSLKTRITVDVCDSWERLSQPSTRSIVQRTVSKLKRAIVRNVYLRLNGKVQNFIYITETDLQADSHHLASANSAVVTNGPPAWCASTFFSERGDPRKLLFVGAGDYGPNREALQETIRMFHNHLELGKVELRVVGPRWAAFQLRGVTFAGWVSDLAGEYRVAGASIGLLNSGAGTSNKVVESIAVGRPVLASARIFDEFRNVQGVFLTTAESLEEVLLRIEKWQPTRPAYDTRFDPWMDKAKDLLNE
jgi:hypothetical protein